MRRLSGRIQLLVLAAFCGMAFLLPEVSRSQENRRAVEAQIKSAIDRASQMLLTKLVTQSDGEAAIATVALLKSGMKPDNPQIKAVIDRLGTRITRVAFTPQQHHVYEAGVSLLALANADPKKHRAKIEVLAKYLIANQGPHGQWHYPGSLDGDTSISQYAILGLWEATRSGVAVPAEVWDRAAAWHIRTQQQDGGFGYHPDINRGGGMASMHSMTVAGIGSLRIARRHLYPNARERVAVESAAKKVNRSGKRYGILEPVYREEESEASSEEVRISARNASYIPTVKLAQIDEAVERGVNWMTTNFTVTRPSGYPIYYLYGLERGATLAEIQTFGIHDWYEEGAAHLVATQTPSHGWTDGSGEVPATAFGILFLTRATSKMVRHVVPRVEVGAGVLVGGRGLPDQLDSAKLNDGKIKGTQKKSPLDELLAQLENPQLPLLESTQADIVEQVLTGKREELIGQVDRLKKLARHKEPDVRRTALWALGRSDDLRLAPLLIQGLKDPDVDVYVEARNALRCLSRQVEDFGAKEEPLDAVTRERELVKWRDWYKSIRAYDERDDLVAPGE